jgi:hypothetical protein
MTDSWRAKRDDRLIWADSLCATDCRTIGTLIYFGPCIDAGIRRLSVFLVSLNPPFLETCDDARFKDTRRRRLFVLQMP